MTPVYTIIGAIVFWFLIGLICLSLLWVLGQGAKCIIRIHYAWKIAKIKNQIAWEKGLISELKEQIREAKADIESPENINENESRQI